MDLSEFQDLVRQEMERTGLDEVTAAKVVSGRAGMTAPPSPASLRITSSSLQAALRAPPTANEPTVIPSPAPSCPACDGAGFYKEAVPLGHPHFGVLFPCACRLEARAAARRAAQSATLATLGDELGSELADCRLHTFDVRRAPVGEMRESLARALSAVRAYADAWRGWLYLWGPTGVGKSHLAAGIAYAGVQAGRQASYASAPKLLRFIKAGFQDDTSDARLAALQEVDLLVLDDLGTETHRERAESDYSDMLLFELLNERYLFRRPTIITSNLPPGRLHDARIGSRITGMCGGAAGVLMLINEDQRGKEKE